jgi:hypothetical protein
MQLEFFGETFDRAKCGKTCDNCKAAREPERRDLTQVAQTLLRLLADVSSQTKGRGVTLVRLGELYRGSKSQPTTKFLNTAKLTGYAAGSKYKKPEIDRILRGMIYERILSETCEQNVGGFNSDYVHPGETAPMILNGQRPFILEFPKVIEGKEGKENKKTPNKQKKQKSVKKRERSEREGGLSFAEHDEDNEEELSKADSDMHRKVGAKVSFPTILSPSHTQQLIDLIKRLAGLWSEEERLKGHDVFCKEKRIFLIVCTISYIFPALLTCRLAHYDE